MRKGNLHKFLVDLWVKQTFSLKGVVHFAENPGLLLGIQRALRNPPWSLLQIHSRDRSGQQDILCTYGYTHMPPQYLQTFLSETSLSVCLCGCARVFGEGMFFYIPYLIDKQK